MATNIILARDLQIEELEKLDVVCFLLSPQQLTEEKPILSSYVEEYKITLIIAVHAYKTGKYLIDIETPYIIILGGTDVNEACNNQDQMSIMTKAVARSKHVVAFSEAVCQRFKLCWPDYITSNISIIPQGVKVTPSDFSVRSYIEKVQSESIQPGCQHSEIPIYGLELQLLVKQIAEQKARIFTVVGGIRPVKNPLLLIEKFTAWRSKRQKQHCWLLFVGENQNDEYFSQFKEAVNRNAGTVYIPGLAIADTHAVIRDSFALVNTSDSEGMAIAILEAMCSMRPVIVRDIPGNRAIVDHGHTGFVFNTTEQFFNIAESLLNDEDQVAMTTKNAIVYVSQMHSPEVEAQSYMSLVKRYSEDKQ